jgi:hypothetical protein
MMSPALNETGTEFVHVATALVALGVFTVQVAAVAMGVAEPAPALRIVITFVVAAVALNVLPAPTIPPAGTVQETGITNQKLLLNV